MPIIPAEGESYTIRRKVLKLFGAAFHIYGKNGELAGFCDQKAFKLREDIRIYTDESKSKELLRIATKSIIDFGATYEVYLENDVKLGSLRRKGLTSTFLRDEWLIFGPDDKQIGILQEESGLLAFLRRTHELFAMLSPQKFVLKDMAGQPFGRLRQHFHMFVYRLGVAVEPDAEARGMDDLFVLAAGCLIAAVEGQQDA